MRLLVVAAYYYDFGAEVLEFLVRVSELAGLGCASLREVFWVEVDDDIFLSNEIF
jgi:hypothetical protein